MKLFFHSLITTTLLNSGLAVLLLTGCDPTPPAMSAVLPPEIKSPDKLSRAIYSGYLQLDPHFIKAVADGAPVRDLLVGLMQFNPQGEVVAGIGREFLSDNGKDWVIVLDENATWSNGEPVTAQDFVASWQRLANRNDASPLAHYLVYMGIVNAKEILHSELPVSQLGVQAEGKYRLKITLTKPNFQFPKMLAHIALLPTFQGKKPQPDQPFISNGSYEIRKQTKNMLDLKARSSNLPFQDVHYQLIGTIQNPDRFDIIENPLESYHRNETEMPRLCTYFYEFNFNNPLLRQKEIRQAIRTMISPSEISRDFGLPNHFVLPKTMVPEVTRRLPIATTEQLFHQLSIDATKPLHLTLTFDNTGQHPKIAQRIARTLAQSDLFRVQFEEVDWQKLQTKREHKEYQLVRGGWCADYDDPMVFLSPFHSSSPDNKSGYKNKKVDELIERLYNEKLGSEQRESLIIEVVRQLENDVAILPLFQYQRRIAIDPEIRGVEMGNPSEVIYSKDLYRQ